MARDSWPWGLGDCRFQRRTELSPAEELTKVSFAGQRLRDVTGAVCPRK